MKNKVIKDLMCKGFQIRKITRFGHTYAITSNYSTKAFVINLRSHTIETMFSVKDITSEDADCIFRIYKIMSTYTKYILLYVNYNPLLEDKEKNKMHINITKADENAVDVTTSKDSRDDRLAFVL